MSTVTTTEIEVEAQVDHLESLTKGNPLHALAELVWNSCDADANEVHITIAENSAGGIEEISISDDGHGLSHQEAQRAFGYLGGSWKKTAQKTLKEKRILHGKEGKGRFKAFALGNEVIWQTVYRANGNLEEYKIVGERSNLKRFSISEPYRSRATSTGTKVNIGQITQTLGILAQTKKTPDQLAEYFALYLHDYPTVSLYYCGNKVDPASAQKDFQQYKLDNISLGEGKEASAVLQIVEWKAKRDRKICLCNEGGFTLHEIDAGIRPGAEFHFTAYLRSKTIEQLHEQGVLDVDEMNEELRPLVDVAREQMRSHFRELKAAAAAELLQEWKDEGIYPYEGEPVDPLEAARRQVFEICALNVNEYLADFRKGETKSRKFTLRMLKEALEDSPSALQRILRDVLELPDERQQELADLLEQTTLSAIIESNKMILDRMTFLKGLEELLFEPGSKKELEERSQLHRILREETWIFGEEYHLTASDQSLTTVLAQYISKLRPGEKTEKVIRDDGREGIIDLMLAREVPQNHKNRREYLVVELKRPSQKINLEVKGQIESYALAVRRDERFDRNNTYWTFIAISNEMTEDAMETITQPHLPRGYFHSKDNCRIGLATWSEILLQCRTRLELFRDKLGDAATTDDGIALLKARYEKYLPTCLLNATKLSDEGDTGSEVQ